MSTEGIVFLFFFFLTLSSIFYVAGTAIRSQKLDKKFKEVLIAEGQINGYIEYIQWMKDRNPWGGLVPASVARKNLIREGDSKELVDIAEQWLENLREHQKRGLIFFILFVSVLLIQTIIYDSNKMTKSEEDALQKDISAFIYNADLCGHLSGEVDDQKPLETDILNKNIDIYCGKAREHLYRLRIKYKDDKKAMKKISSHTYDSVESYSKPTND